jgi:hypothetical protein
MDNDYKENDYLWIKELLDYPATLETNLGSFHDTSQITLPQDPIEFVIFQDRANARSAKSPRTKVTY